MTSKRFFPLLVLILLLAAPAQAAKVRVTVTADEAGAPLERQSLAMEKAFAAAVAREALDILPKDPGADRALNLEKFLSSRADELVTGYSELGRQEGPDFFSLSLDVNVNKRALTNILKRIGIFYTLDERVPYELVVKGPAMEKWQEIAELQSVSGLSVVGSADNVLTLDFDPEAGWSGELASQGQDFTARRTDLADVWYSLWGRYFSQEPVQAGRTESMVLKVSGWTSPDGVTAFDAELRALPKILENVVLLDVALSPEGVDASWRVDAIDRGALESVLIDRLRGRGLTFTYETS